MFQKADFNKKKGGCPNELKTELLIFCMYYLKSRKKTIKCLVCIFWASVFHHKLLIYSLPVSYHHTLFQVFLQLLQWCDFIGRCSFFKKTFNRSLLLYVLVLGSWMKYLLLKLSCIRVWLAARYSGQHNS